MKIYRYLLLWLFVGTFSATIAQNVSYQILSQTDEEIRIKVQFPEYQLTPIDIDDITYQKLQMNDCYPIENLGAPELLKSVFSLVTEDVPQEALIESSDYEVIDNIILIPSKGRLYRNVNPDTIPYHKGESYLLNEFIGENQLTISDLYQIRDIKGINISCLPFAYNPTTKQLKVFHSMVIVIRNSIGFTTPLMEKKNTEYDKIYKERFLNYQPAKYGGPSQAGEMLIIAYDAFMDAMQPFVVWKNRSGIPTTMVSLSSVGTTANQVKNYIHDYYQNHNLSYVITVGDAAQFPPRYINSGYYGTYIADNDYACIVGNDSYPDIMLGKISAENVNQVAIQVRKFIEYERNPQESSHFSSFVGIASNEGPGDNGEADWEHIRLIGQELQNFTYTAGYEFFDGAHGGLDASGYPTANMVTSALNSGAGIINYCGHGDWNKFVTTSFDIYDVNSLSNYNKLPFIFSVACVNGEYNRTQPCFAETWLRVTKNGESTGAVGTLMSTINQPWSAPMCGQDEMNRMLSLSNSGTFTPSFGYLSFCGLMKMLDIYEDVETFNSWLLFGDPSLMVRTAIPQTITAIHDTVLFTTDSSLVVESPNEDALVTLSHQNEIVAQNHIANGEAILNFSTFTLSDTLNIVITKFNHKPYEGKINIHFNKKIVPKFDKILLFPNPAVNSISLMVKPEFLSGYTYSIVDMQGRTIGQEKITNIYTEIDISQYRLGIYVLKINSSKKTITTKKFIKQ